MQSKINLIKKEGILRFPLFIAKNLLTTIKYNDILYLTKIKYKNIKDRGADL